MSSIQPLPGAIFTTAKSAAVESREPGLYGRRLALSRSRLALARLVSLLAVAAGAGYLAWRLTTLAGTGPVGIVFYAAEAANFLALALAVVLLFRMRVRESGQIAAPSGTLDVFVTVCGESVGMVEETLRAALAIEYPHNTFLLNDGRLAGKPGWQEMEALAERLGVPCLTRTDGKAAKAGNLNHGLRATSGDFVAVVDADHQVRPDFAHELLGYFRDPMVGFVCTPQQFRGPPDDPLNNRELLFYRALQPSKDAANAAFSCGNAVVYRRGALDSIDGFSEWNLVEDLHTSYELHARSWRSVYHPRALSTGEAPSTASALAKQRHTWATDSLRIFFWDNPLWKRGLTMWQRLHYLHTTSFYLVAMCQVLFLLAPPLYLLFDVPVMRFDDVGEYALASGLYFGSVFLFLVAYGGRGGIRAVQQVLFLAPTYLLACLRALLPVRPRSRVTEKEKQSRFSSILIPQHAALALSLAAIGYAVTLRDESMTIAAGWTAWNVIMIAGFMTAVGGSHRLAGSLKTALRIPAVAAVACIALIGPSATGPLEPSARAATAVLDTAAAAPPAARQIAVAAPKTGTYLGVFNPSLPFRRGGIAAWSRAHGLDPHIVHWYQQWGSGEPRFREDWLKRVARSGAIPMITWEPWQKPAGSVHDAEQPRYRLSAIAAGDFDPYIRSWARAAAAYGRPMFLRPMHEMNGNWYPWSIKTNGGSARAFVRAWRRIHRLFDEEGAANVRWVWAVNTFTGLGGEDRKIGPYYPGDSYVDWVSVTGFNWGTTNTWSEWQSIDQVIGRTYRRLVRFGKPVMISELATVQEGGDGTRWMRTTLRRLEAAYPRVKAVVWFDARYPGGIDFRLQEGQSAALAAAAASAHWTPRLRVVTAASPRKRVLHAASS